MYGGAKLKVWQVVVLGALWIALGIVLDQSVEWDAPRTYVRRRGTHEIFVALKLWITLPTLVGLWHWYRAWEAYRLEKAEASSTTLPVQTAPLPRPSVPLPKPPRLGDDPFRDPPAAPPIIVHRPPTAPAAVPIVPGDPDDKPKLLT
jgi:hypothetical protein